MDFSHIGQCRFQIFYRRQKELEEKLIEEEVARRVEELVAKRVEEELEKRKDEIEAEVKRRVEEAKRIMEAQMLEELERQRETELENQKKLEVWANLVGCLGKQLCCRSPRLWGVGQHDFAIYFFKLFDVKR